jgi:hypothetical protein
MAKKEKKTSYWELLKKGVIRGIGWAFGATIGFAIVSTILIIILRQAGGLPLVGSFIATIVDSTLEQLVQRSPIFPQ